MSDQVQISVYLTRAQADWLKRQSDREHRSVSQQVGLYIEYGIHERRATGAVRSAANHR